MQIVMGRCRYRLPVWLFESYLYMNDSATLIIVAWFFWLWDVVHGFFSQNAAFFLLAYVLIHTSYYLTISTASD